MVNFKKFVESRKIIIPDNQRGYSWTNSQRDDVFNDLRLLPKDKHHYFGPILITSEPEALRDVENDLIEECTLEDGQQRVTSFFIFLFFIRKRLTELIKEEIEKDEEDQDKTYIKKLEKQEGKLEDILYYQMDNSPKKFRLENKTKKYADFIENLLTGLPVTTETYPEQMLLELVNYSKNKFSHLGWDKLYEHFRNLTINSKFIIVDLKENNVDKYTTFDAINSRGLELSIFDKIKNYCILLVERDKDDTSRVKLQHLKPEQEWYKAISQLQRFGVGLRDPENVFMHDIYNVFFKTRKRENKIHESFVDHFQSLLTESDAKLEKDLTQFIELWVPYAQSYGFVTTKTDSTRLSCKDYKLGHDLANSVALDWMIKRDNLGKQEATRIFLTAAHYIFNLTLKDVDFQEVARLAEIYTFRVLAIARASVDTSRSQFIDMSNNLIKKKSLQNYHYLHQEICKILTEEPNYRLKANVERLLNGEKKYPWEGSGGWKDTFYFIYEYEQSISRSVPLVPFKKRRTEQKETIEHIVPKEYNPSQKHASFSSWHLVWTDEEHHKNWKHRLGNLVMTANQSSNSILTNKSIDLKINDPDPDSKYDYSCSRSTNAEKKIANFLDHRGNFFKESILLREIEYAKFFLRRWDINCCGEHTEDSLSTIILPDDFGLHISKETKVEDFVIPRGEQCVSSYHDPDEEEEEEEKEMIENNKIPSFRLFSNNTFYFQNLRRKI